MNYKIWTEKEIETLKQIYPIKDRNTTLKILAPRTWPSIEHKALGLGIRKNIPELKNRLFKLLEETPEAYYWIGFIAADGYFHHKNKTFNLNLSSKDEIHIKNFCKFINGQYRKRIAKNIRNGIDKKDEYVVVNSQDKVNIEKIITKFNFKHKKTYNPPNELNIKDDNLFIAFLIGFIDGDGHIGPKNHIGIKCHFSWEKCLKEWINRTCEMAKVEDINMFLARPRVKVVTQIYKGKEKKYVSIQTSNHIFVMFLKDKIKELGLPSLKRKWNRIKYIKNNYNDRHIRKLEREQIPLEDECDAQGWTEMPEHKKARLKKEAELAAEEAKRIEMMKNQLSLDIK